MAEIDVVTLLTLLLAVSGTGWWTIAAVGFEPDKKKMIAFFVFFAVFWATLAVGLFIL